MKNQTSDDLYAGSVESENEAQDNLLMTPGAEAIFRSTLEQRRGSITSNEEGRQEEENYELFETKQTLDDDDKEHHMETVPGSSIIEESDSNNTDDDDFVEGTREEVNGAAAFFFGAGFLIGGPLAAIGTGMLSSHLAANKTGPIADFCRKCGNWLDGIGKDKNQDPPPTQQQPATTSQALVVVARPHHQIEPKEKGLWSKITDEFVKGSEYVEGRLFVGVLHR